MWEYPPEVKCQVINFELPQKTTDWENAILAYGDPDYITYWQNFPEGEEGSWESLVLWESNLGLVVLAAIPLVKAGGAILKSVDKISDVAPGVGSTLSNTLSKLFTGGKKGKVLLTDGLASSADDMVRVRPDALKATTEYLDEVAAGLGSGTKFSAMTKIQQQKFLSKLFTLESKGSVSWNTIARIVAAGGAVSVEGLTVAGWFLDRTLSIAAKFDKQPNNMVLKLPFYPVQKLALSDDMKYKMVVLDKPKMFDTTGYLASPCKANLEVSMDMCRCEKSSYTVIEGDTVYGADNKFLETLTDLPNTSIDETKDLDGTVNCKLVTEGHDIAEAVTSVVESGSSFLYFGATTFFSSKEEALDQYYVAKDANAKLMDVLRAGNTIEVPCAKIKDTWHDDSGTNFCYASASGVGTAVLVGSLALDVILEIGSVGAATQVAVGIGVFAASYYATHTTTWPGHNSIFWSS